MSVPEAYPLPGYPNFLSDPLYDGRCPNDGNVYFWYDHAHFCSDGWPDGTPGMSADNDGTQVRRMICTLCYTQYTYRETAPGRYLGPIRAIANDRVVVRTASFLGVNVLYQPSAGLYIPALVVMTPESWVSGAALAKPNAEKLHLTYYVVGGFAANVTDNTTHLVTGTTTAYWKEVLNVAMGTGVGQWWFIESE